MVNKPSDLARNLISVNEIVCIKELDKFTVRDLITAVPRGARSRIRLSNELNARVEKPLDFINRPVLGRIVDDNNFNLRPRLPEDGFQRFADVFRGVVAGNDDRNCRTDYQDSLTLDSPAPANRDGHRADAV